MANPLETQTTPEELHNPQVSPMEVEQVEVEQRQVELMDLERLVELDFVRTTEAAALNAYHWLGKGDPQAAHAAAVDAMRGTLDLTSVSASVAPTPAVFRSQTRSP